MTKKKFLQSSQPLEVLKKLKKKYPDAYCELVHQTPFQLLVATILSAQCTDERVNKVTPELFRLLPDAKAMAEAPLTKIEELVRSTGFYKNKAKNIKSCSQDLCDKFDGHVPENSDELVKLAGVGRKTANVVLGVAFNIPNGIVVDTHVIRISQRLGLTKRKTPEKIENDLVKLVPKKDWIKLSHQMIFLGRQICKARTPNCDICPLETICPKNDYQ